MKSIKYKGGIYRAAAPKLEADKSKRMKALSDMEEALASTHYLAESSAESIKKISASIEHNLWVLGAATPHITREIKGLQTKLAELDKSVRALLPEAESCNVHFTQTFGGEIRGK